ncbi:MAG: diacylglycerol kinase family lipid kinase [Anaerolineales bacterium]|nr:diacylglycerol kinase family lipid kinase [Anaerolineales bacterium]
MARYKIIVNPTSGRGEGGRSVPAIEENLKRLGLDYDLVLTERPLHAIELAKEAVADGYDVVVAAGGDGTANEVLNGLVLAKEQGVGEAAYYVIGVGRGNDLAFGMKMPADLDEACQALAEDKRMIVDVGKVTGGLFPDGRYFGNGVGIGFDAVVGFEAVKLKRLSGFPSYIVAALKTIFLYYKAPKVEIEVNGKTLTEKTLMVSVMNGRRMGGGFMMAPEGENDDGVFDLCIAKEVGKLRIFTLIPRFMAGTQATEEPIITDRMEKIVVRAIEGSLPAHADGETLCEAGQELVMEILPKQIEVIYS